MSILPSETNQGIASNRELDAVAKAAQRPTGWILATVILGAATLMLLIWVASLEAHKRMRQPAKSMPRWPRRRRAHTLVKRASMTLLA
jgi:hypothetical protein